MGGNVEERLARLRQVIEEREACAVLVTDMLNVRYFSGFTGSSATLLVTADKVVFLTDSRYTTQAADQTGLSDIIEYQSRDEALGGLCRDLGLKTVLFEGQKRNGVCPPGSL